MDVSEKHERLLEAASLLLSFAPNQTMKSVILNKALFYLDLAALRDLGRTISGNVYIALHQGPVVAKYDSRLMGALKNDGIATVTGKGDAILVTLTNPAAPQHLRNEDRALAEKVADYFSQRSSAEASEYSHKNPGWRLAYRGGHEAGNRPNPIDLQIAMQQIVDSDPWLDEPVDEKTMRILTTTDNDEEGEPW